MRRLALLVTVAAVVLASACATRSVPPDAAVVATLKPHSGYRSGEILPRAALPTNALVATQGAPLQVLVEIRAAHIVGMRQVAAQEANLTVAFAAQGRERSAIDLNSSLDRALKLDLFVSRDGENFAYVASCPVLPDAGAFAQWPHRVLAVAIAAARDAQGSACE